MVETNALEVTLAADPSAIEKVSLLQAVAEPVRWAVMTTLAEAPRCVCEIQAQIPTPANLLSYHLKALRDAGLVTATRRGRWVDYALAAGALDRLRAALPGAVSVTPS